MHDQFLSEAIQLAVQSVGTGGGPFGAVIVRSGRIIGRGTNCVTTAFDPTAHAEVVAIRQACDTLKDFRLSGCTLYTSCEPCPMCLGASYWARLEEIFFAASRTDAAASGFDDEFLYQELSRPPEARKLPLRQRRSAEAQRPFETWSQREDRIEY